MLTMLSIQSTGIIYESSFSVQASSPYLFNLKNIVIA